MEEEEEEEEEEEDWSGRLLSNTDNRMDARIQFSSCFFGERFGSDSIRRPERKGGDLLELLGRAWTGRRGSPFDKQQREKSIFPLFYTPRDYTTHRAVVSAAL
jgi:hypothetical protein